SCGSNSIKSHIYPSRRDGPEFLVQFFGLYQLITDLLGPCVLLYALMLHDRTHRHQLEKAHISAFLLIADHIARNGYRNPSSNFPVEKQKEKDSYHKVFLQFPVLIVQGYFYISSF